MNKISSENLKEQTSQQSSLSFEFGAERSGQTGAALVMALLILSLMMTSAVALSRIILGEVKMSINTVNSMNSFYAADSGIEKGLYYIKYARQKQGTVTDSTLPFTNLFNNTYNINASSFSYVQASTTSPGFTIYNVTTSTPAHVDIVDPSGNISTIDWDTEAAAGDGHYYTLTWDIDACFPFHASDKLEITTYSFANPGTGWESKIDKDIIICNCQYNSNDVCDTTLTTRSISDSNFYRFSFRPLDDTVKSIAFNVYTDPIDGSLDYITGIASKAAITVDGGYKNSSYRMKVEIPILGALSDIFSYVIFTEEDLIKNL